jgi:hypothetical protein
MWKLLLRGDDCGETREAVRKAAREAERQTESDSQR